ncbi:hypothetical protein GCM10027341_03420 [Spirosoma knui]
MSVLSSTFRQTLTAIRLLWLMYGVTLVLGLLAAIPFYNTLKAEGQSSLAFLNLLDGFDYTVYSDFMHQSGKAIDPLLSVGSWLGVLYVCLSLFFGGGILVSFAQPQGRFNAGVFWQACSHYVGRFTRLLGVTGLFLVAGAGIWLILGTLAGVLLSDTLTERGLFWIGVAFFALFVLTATLVLCVSDYAKVLMFREDEPNSFRAFGQAGRLVLRNLRRTYGLYWLFLLIGAGMLGLYLLLDATILMSGWLTILLMFLIQQALVFARIGLKVWALGAAYSIYTTLPKPVIQPVYVPGTNQSPDTLDSENNTEAPSATI